MSRTPIGQRLPDFPWDSLTQARATAAAHPDGLIDLSIGTPVDEVAPSIQLAVATHAAQGGYPDAVGTPALRQAAAEWLTRHTGVGRMSADDVIPVIGTKEAIAWLPTMLGCTGAVAIPTVGYPTYEVAALTAGCRAVRFADLASVDPAEVDIIFLNSPANPTGAVLDAEELRHIVEFAREHDIVVASDECYFLLGWDDDRQPVSILDDAVSEGDHHNLIAVHSLSKSVNLASYRAGFMAGDPELMAQLRLVRKHTGMMVPTMVQEAMVAALRDDTQADWQRLRYAKRRAVLLPALIAAGFRVDHSEAGLYLWATRGEPCRDTVAWFAERGIVVAPGEFYGPAGAEHVRVSLTATDEHIADAARRCGTAE